MPRRKQKPSLKERRRRARIITLVLSGILALSLLIFVAVVARIPETKVVKINSSPVLYANNIAINGVVTDMLKGSYLFIIPRSNSFFIPSTSIKNEIEKTFHSIKSVAIKRVGLKEIFILLEEETPSYRWCTSIEEKEGCFLMNSEGYLFAPATDNQEGLVRFMGEIEGQPIGSTFLSEKFQALSKAVISIEKSIEERVVLVSVDEHNDVSVYFEGGGYIQFVLSASYEVLIDNISAVFSSKKIEQGQALEYADFRFGNKIYVKFKEE